MHREGTQSLQLLLKPDMTYFKDHRGRTVLQHAAEKGSMTACELILRMRTDAVYDTDKMVSEREGGIKMAHGFLVANCLAGTKPCVYH